MSTNAESRINAIERRIAKQRPKGTIIVIEIEGVFSCAGRDYDSLPALREGENLHQDAKLFVCALEPTEWTPN